MQEDEKQKEPIEMTTDEAIDYLFAPEIAEQLRREAGQIEEPDAPESEQDC
jgi:hypothetical protein